MSRLRGKFIKDVLKPAYTRTAMPTIWAVHSRYPIGTNIFSRDWDVLVILDTCRVDALREVAPEYNWLPPIDSIDKMRSVGSATVEWIASTFVEQYREEVGETVYITGNAQPQKVLRDREFPEQHEGVWAPTNWQTVEEDALQDVVHAWKYARKDMAGGMHPALLTDIAVEEHRDQQPERMIVHYSPPHHPYPYNAIREGREMTDTEADPFGYLLNGGDRETVWELYMDTLRYVLPYVHRLLSAVDAPAAVISADHGDAFGEWGFYSHPFASFVPQVRNVPWAELSMPGESSYEPKFDRNSTEPKRKAKEQLKVLGYL